MTFIDACEECISNDDFVKHWNRLTGHKLGENRSPIVMAVDKACGYDLDKEALPDFVDFFIEYIWKPLVLAGAQNA